MEATLFDRPLSHTQDPITSYEAADKMIKSGRISRQEQEVYYALKLYALPDGNTAKQLAAMMDGDYTRNYFKIQRRLSGLFNKSKVERVMEDGKLVKRDGCCVWRTI